jgi:hypothetical protein
MNDLRVYKTGFILIIIIPDSELRFKAALIK